MFVNENIEDPVSNLISELDNLDYVADSSIATSLHLAQLLDRPLLIEGRPGVGKTEIASTMARLLNTQFIRLQCYEGLDVNSALYEWNYSRQLLWIRMKQFGQMPSHVPGHVLMPQ